MNAYGRLHLLEAEEEQRLEAALRNAAQIARLTGQKEFRYEGESLGYTILDYCGRALTW